MMELFAGYMDAHGTHGAGVANAAKGGKLEIRTTARTLRESVTEELWERHLAGTYPIGNFPIRRDDTVLWGAIDVDDYTLTQEDIVKRIKREGWPLHVCRTKSGGSHCYLFLKEPVPAETMIKKLTAMAAVLGFQGSEIFPKQAGVLWDSGDFGSWLNMPYLGGDKGTRYCVGANGKGMTLRQFLDAAEASRLNDVELSAIGEKVAKDPEFGNGPPCLGILAAAKLQQGQQNTGLLAFGVFAKKKYPGNWEIKLTEWARLHCDPPVPENDDGLKTIIKNLRKKQYNYTCNDQPICAHCNVSLCKTRKYGVGEGGNMPKMGNLAVLNTDEPLWFMDVEGVRVQMTTTDLLNYAAFQGIVLNATQVLPPMLKRDTWITVIQGLLAEVVVIDAPTEAGRMGQFMEIVEGFLTDRQRGETKEELLLGKPWWDEDEGRVYFRLRDVQDACERQRFRVLNRTQMTSKLRELGGEHNFVKLRGKGVNVWSLPTSGLEVQTEEHALPGSLREQVI